MNSQSYKQSARLQTSNQAKQQPLKNQSIPLNNKEQMKLQVEKAEEENRIFLEKIEQLRKQFKQYETFLKTPVNASKHLQYREAQHKIQRQMLEFQNRIRANRQLIKDWESGIQLMHKSIPLNSKEQMKLQVEKAEEENEILLEKLIKLKKIFSQYETLLIPSVDTPVIVQDQEAYHKVQRQILELQNRISANRQLVKDQKNGIQLVHESIPLNNKEQIKLKIKKAKEENEILLEKIKQLRKEFKQYEEFLKPPVVDPSMILRDREAYHKIQRQIFELQNRIRANRQLVKDQKNGIQLMHKSIHLSNKEQIKLQVEKAEEENDMIQKKLEKLKKNFSQYETLLIHSVDTSVIVQEQEAYHKVQRQILELQNELTKNMQQIQDWENGIQLVHKSIPLNSKEQIKLQVEKAEQDNQMNLKKLKELKQQFAQYKKLLKSTLNAAMCLQYKEAYRKVQRQILELLNEITQNMQFIQDWQNGIQFVKEDYQFQTLKQSNQQLQHCKSESKFNISIPKRIYSM